MSAPHPTVLRREQPIQKAARLLIDDRVHRLDPQAVYQVQGDTDTYLVLVSPAGAVLCPCRARTPLCAHVLAVVQARSVEQEMSLGVVA